MMEHFDSGKRHSTVENKATLRWISGPVLRANTDLPFHINEAVYVGEHQILGEVIRLHNDEIVVQLYEDTTGLRPGDALVGSGSPLAVKLGPGLLGNIYDGLLRPLGNTKRFVRRGMYRQTSLHFEFEARVGLGEKLQNGAIFGMTRETGRFPQRCLLPPDVCGEVVSIAKAGSYADDAEVCRIKNVDGLEHSVSMSHLWPIRKPRPVTKRIATWGPLFTGQRILDSIFPLACGGRAAMPGGFGTGKTVLQETLAKWCDADIIVYVGCGERGNEMAGVLEDLPNLTDPRTGRSLMERTVIIANTSNMPVAAREASVYTAVTVAEYFRDQGLRVALMADSTSRWAEALREVSGRLGEIPSESGYPAYLSSRLADFYERAAHVRALCGKVGSVTLIGAVSPPSGDFSEPVTTHTKRYVRVFWVLDSVRAQSRFYPAIHPLQSYSGDVEDLESFWTQHNHSQWLVQRKQFLTLLEEQTHLERMARIVGVDALPPRQQHVLLCADLVNEAFLRQSAFSEKDRYCSPERQVLMMQLLSRFIELSSNAVQQQVSMESIHSLPILRRIRRMGEEIGEDDLPGFGLLNNEMERVFSQLMSRREYDREVAGDNTVNTLPQQESSHEE
ncbi:MAG: V-type ATP synthase subunit A [Gammaproteobacteria bacterium]|nr:V-type ATP synthase subunit A [Gammaproteobacteria bacterium]MDH5800688.1 V-type ATP synthase subunit A [Gammaproteobacteria bacterium]